MNDKQIQEEIIPYLLQEFTDFLNKKRWFMARYLYSRIMFYSPTDAKEIVGKLDINQFKELFVHDTF